MPEHKADISLPPRTPAYVDRETGAAELSISPEMWDKLVRDGTLPPPAAGFPVDIIRWRWADVDRMLAGEPTDAVKRSASDEDSLAAIALKGARKRGRKPSSLPVSDAHTPGSHAQRFIETAGSLMGVPNKRRSVREMKQADRQARKSALSR